MITDERNKLIGLLNNYFPKIRLNKKALKVLHEKLSKKHNMDSGTMNGIVQGMTLTESLSDEYLYWFAESLEKELSIDKNEFFFDKEIKQYSKSKIDYSRNPFPIVFEDVLQVNFDQYLATVSCERLYELYKDQVIKYNLETQRNPRYRKDSEGNINKIININRKSVEQIKNLLKRGLFIPNMLTLNIRDDISEKPHDFYNNTLVISDYGIDIIDGYHRYLAVTQTMIENINLNLNFILHITVFNEDKARRYIAQEDKRNKINSVYSKMLDDTSYGSRIVKELKENDSFYLSERMRVFGIVKGETINSGKMIVQIEQNFNINSSLEANQVKKYIFNNINSLIERRNELLNTIQDKELRIIITCLGIFYNTEQGNLLDKIEYYLEFFNMPDNQSVFYTKNGLRNQIIECELKSKTVEAEQESKKKV